LEDVVYFDFNDFDRCALRLLIGSSHTVIPSGAVADVNQSKAELLQGDRARQAKIKIPRC
jgi:hypothetical protein